jgi:hypothetical protein
MEPAGKPAGSALSLMIAYPKRRKEHKMEILPVLNDPLTRLAVATELSLRYLSLIRRGDRVPHPCHRDAFREAFVR